MQEKIKACYRLLFLMRIQVNNPNDNALIFIEAIGACSYGMVAVLA